MRNPDPKTLVMTSPMVAIASGLISASVLQSADSSSPTYIANEKCLKHLGGHANLADLEVILECRAAKCLSFFPVTELHCKLAPARSVCSLGDRSVLTSTLWVCHSFAIVRR